MLVEVGCFVFWDGWMMMNDGNGNYNSWCYMGLK